MSVNNSAPRALSKPRKPLLIMPVHDDYNQQCDLYNHVGSKISQTYSRGKSDQSSRCVGSSKGWLVLNQSGDHENCLSLFSPLSGNVRRIVLPACARPSDFWTRWITKAVVTLSPGLPGYAYGLVFLYGVCDYKIALLAMQGDREDGNKWIELKSCDGRYSDVLSNQDSVFGLLTSGSVDVWDLRSSTDGRSIDKKLRIEAKYLDRVIEFEEKLRDLYTSNSYLVESQGNLLLVIRIIGEFVRENGEVVNEGALLDDEVYSHLVLPYKTKNFYVHKLDMMLKKWVRIESLEDQVLFLGLNESVAFAASDIPECRRNSIYFTDDHWDHINIHEHDLYGGHDMGVFDLSDKNVEEIFEIRRMVPPPVWIDQNISAAV